MKHRAVFADRDGTINVDVGYLGDPEGLVLIEGALEGLRLLGEAGFLLFVVTNQSGIGRGYYTLEDMHRVNQRLIDLAGDQGVTFERIYFSPEAPEEPSPGRKPSPRFLLDAGRDFEVDLARSYMIGDKGSDLECGRNAGVRRSLLVRTGYGERVLENGIPDPDRIVVVENLLAAAEWILGQ